MQHKAVYTAARNNTATAGNNTANDTITACYDTTPRHCMCTTLIMLLLAAIEHQDVRENRQLQLTVHWKLLRT